MLIEKFNLITRTYAILGDEPWIWYKFEDLNNLNIVGNVGLSGVSIRGTNSVFINNNGLNSPRNYIQIPTSIITSQSQLNQINTSSGISISFWFYLTNDTYDYSRIFYLGNYSQIGLYDITFNRIQISIGTKSNSYLSFNIYQGNQVKQQAHLNPVYNNWRHIVWTISNQGIWNIYIDNIKKTNNFGGFVIPPFTSHFTYVYALGMDMHYNNYGMNGYLDDFRIYRRVLNDDEVNELYTSSGTDGRIYAENARNLEQGRINNFRNQKKEELRQLRINLEKYKNIIDNQPNQELIKEYNSQMSQINTNLDGIQNTQEMTNIINSITQSVNNFIGRINNIINSVKTSSLSSLNEIERKLNTYDNANNSIKTLISTFRNNINNYFINKIQTDLASITTTINNYIKDLLISSARTSITKSLENLKKINNKKTELNFGIYNNIYNEIDGSITNFIGSLNNPQTDVNNLGIEITKINQQITTLTTDINSLTNARADAIKNIDIKNAVLDDPDFIANKDLINDNSLNNIYNNLKNNINNLKNSLNTFVSSEINRRIVEIDRDYPILYNQIALQSTKIKALELLNKAKQELNSLREKVIEVPEISLTNKFNNFLRKIDNYTGIINNSTSVNDINVKKTEIDVENKALVIEINLLYEKEIKRRQETIQETLYSYKERGLLNSPIENFRMMNRRFEYTPIMIEYSGEGNTEIIANDVIFGNHFKRRIGGIEIRYSSRVSVDNNPSRLFNGSLAINNKSSFKVQELQRIVMNGEEIRGEFISFKYNKKFVLKKYGFRMSEDWKKAVGLWEVYYLDENGVYKLLDNNEVRLTKDDYNKTDMDNNHYIKFLLDNEELTNEILIIFTGKIESDDKNNRGINISQVFLNDGKISNVVSTCNSIEEEGGEIG